MRAHRRVTHGLYGLPDVDLAALQRQHQWLSVNQRSPMKPDTCIVGILNKPSNSRHAHSRKWMSPGERRDHRIVAHAVRYVETVQDAQYWREDKGTHDWQYPAKRVTLSPRALKTDSS